MGSFAQGDPQTFVVHVTKYGYSPQKIVVVLGDVIKFVNDDVKKHKVIFQDTGLQQEIEPFESWEYKTGNIGKFKFTDQLYPKRTGLLIVDGFTGVEPQTGVVKGKSQNYKKNIVNPSQRMAVFWQKIRNGILSLLR